MIAYQTVGTNDIKKAAAFFDALLGEMGATRHMDEEDFIVWATAPDAPGFCVIKPYNQKEATIGNGSMTAFAAKDPQMVDKMHARALELGAKDEGAAGPRGEGAFYAGYFRDLDGNKFNFFCVPEQNT